MPMPASCTGNAYICRVARKLERIVELHERVLRYGWSVPPWQMDGKQFLALVALAVGYECPGRVRGAVAGLLKAVETNPGVCPILADALEEAGCMDADLSAALRTT
jgi:hypothetical protein